MTENKRAIHTDLAKLDAHEIQPEEYDDIPELTDEFFEKADLYIGDKLIRPGRGRPPLDTPKKLGSPCVSSSRSPLGSAPADAPGNPASTQHCASISGASEDCGSSAIETQAEVS